MHDTPLGQIASIRAEKDPKVIANFTPEQKRIRNEWILRKAREIRENPEAYRKQWEVFQQWAKQAFGKK